MATVQAGDGYWHGPSQEGIVMPGTLIYGDEANPASARISTETTAGSALTIPDDYAYGEMWELRWTYAETGNTAKNGIFLEVRTSAANSSGIRGMEVHAAQEGAIAVGGLEGGNFSAITRSSTTGNIGYMYGITGEVSHNSSAYTGTVAKAAAVRGKFGFEDGTTYTYASIFRGEIEAGTGGGAINAGISLHSTASATVNYLIDTSDIESTNYSANRVVLWKFKDSGGTDRFLVFDADAATTVLVDSNETE